MSGVFSRNKYDQGAYEHSLKQSTGPLIRTLNPIRNDRDMPSRIADPGFFGSVGVSVTHQRPLIDVESELMRLSVKNSDDPSAQRVPALEQSLYHLPAQQFNTDYTRLSNPVCTAREQGVNRFQPIRLNPQDESRWLHPSEIRVSYRNVIKDRHVPFVPKPIDQTPALPPKTRFNIPAATCPAVQTCGAFIGALHPHGKSKRN